MALSLLSPIFLWGLTAAAIPVIIHLIHTQRARVRPFSSLRFLKLSYKRTAKKFKLKNILLLLLRMFTLALLALALTKPILKVSKSPLFGSNAASSLVLILDNSYSMGYRDEGISRFDQAKKAGRDILDTLKEGDEVTIILMNEKPELVFKDFTHEIDMVKDELREAKLSNRGTEIRSSLRKASELIKKSDKPNREIHLLTDLQEISWQSMLEDNFLPEESDKKVSTYITSFGHSGLDNVFIEEVNLLTESAAAVGAPVEISAKVTNLSSPGPVDEILTLSIDGVKKLQEAVSVSPGIPAVVTMSYIFHSPGVRTGKLTIKGDQLSQDDSYYFKVKIEDKIPVLCLDGDPSQIPPLSESFYMMAALNPARLDPAETESAIFPSRIELSDLTGENLLKYQSLILCNVPYLEDVHLMMIEEYLKAGGNLIIFLGGKVEPERYNGWEFIPCEVVSPQGYPDKGNYFNLGDVDYTHPIFRKFGLPGNGDLTLPKFYQCYSINEKSRAPDCHILARFTNGFPAVVERNYGMGRVLMVTTTCDSEWTNFPLRAVYLPLVHEMVYYMSRRKTGEKYHVGDPVNFQSTLTAHKEKIFIADPENTRFTLTPSPSGRGSYSLGTFEETDFPGIYTVSSEGEESSPPGGHHRAFAVNLNTRESMLNMIPIDRIKTLFGELPLTVVTNPDGLPSVLRRSRQGIELWPKLLTLVLVLFMIELVLANRFSYLRDVRKGKAPTLRYVRRRGRGEKAYSS